MSFRASLIGCVLFLIALGGVADAGQASRQGTWSARVGTGTKAPMFGGTWTATADPATGAVTGSWTLIDAKGKIVTRGAWSAAKSATGWTGSWRAVVEGSKGEYSGTWSANVKLKPDARFADLFEGAVKAAVSGSWRAHRSSGQWSIRALE